MNKLKSIKILSLSLFFMINISLNSISQDIRITYTKSGNIFTVGASPQITFTNPVTFEEMDCFIRYLNSGGPVLTVTGNSYPHAIMVKEYEFTDPFNSQYKIAKFSFLITSNPDLINWSSGINYPIFSF